MRSAVKKNDVIKSIYVSIPRRKEKATKQQYQQIENGLNKVE